ncbi:membrane protein [Steroidobacter agaridevorans]|uniref:Membrane protein n=1 Tax=Steroidobacter agaridevorans TaxID=2695856 RepID=A0A829Y9T1_9GAMM|nr:DUF2167 domain-containing protein [Steroidobacter agaridevorans]GFE80069.1 membrane protein [Steroidobacter agaridevorans]
MTRGFAAAISAVWLAFSFSTIQAEEAAADAQPSPGEAAWAAADAAKQTGPAKIELRDQASLQLPAGYIYIPAREGKAVMDAMGNQTDDRFLGLILPESQAGWFVTLDYEPAGYIKDDDAKDWDADELLQSLKDGTEAANEHREQMGIAPIEVTRWVETPSYDASTHRLIWAAEARDKGGADRDPSINYNTYVLGREGYISLNLITAASAIETDKSAARELLSVTDFNSGKRYADFDPSTDKVAAYGLAALVGGLAAKKLGLLAMVGAFLLKFAKIIFIAVVAAGGAIMKFIKGKKEAAEGAS